MTKTAKILQGVHRTTRATLYLQKDGSWGERRTALRFFEAMTVPTLEDLLKKSPWMWDLQVKKA